MENLRRIAAGILCFTGSHVLWANERYRSAHDHFSSKSFSGTWIWVGVLIAALFLSWLLYRYFKKKD